MTILAINMIRRDGGTQMRVNISDATVESYASDMEAGHAFPPVTVFYDGKAHWLADGFHRLAARDLLSIKDRSWATVEIDLHSGTRYDAIAWAIGANKTNGLRRTNADKQVAVRAALAHPDMQKMSDQAIANKVGVSCEMIRKSRAQVPTVGTSSDKPANHKAVNTATDRWAKTIGTDGKQYPARKQSRPSSPERSPGGERENSRVEVSKQRAEETAKQKHVCPTCNGEGFIYE